MQLAFTIYDSVTLQYFFPFGAMTKEDAVRKVAGTLKKGGTQLNETPHNFSLYQTGSFDELTGLLIPDEKVTHIANVDTINASITKD